MAKSKSTTRSNEDHVMYTGTSHVREITKKEWKAAGIDGETVRWDASNNYMVPVSELSFLSEEEYVTHIEGDGDFKLVTGDSELPKSHPSNQRFQQPETYTEGMATGGMIVASTPVATVGGSTSGATATGATSGSTGGGNV